MPRKRKEKRKKDHKKSPSALPTGFFVAETEPLNVSDQWLDDRAGTQTSGAHPNLFRVAARGSGSYTLQIRQPAPTIFIMGMAYIITGHRLFPADFTFTSHNILLQGKISGITESAPIFVNYHSIVENNILPVLRIKRRDVYTPSGAPWQGFYPYFSGATPLFFLGTFYFQKDLSQQCLARKPAKPLDFRAIA